MESDWGILPPLLRALVEIAITLVTLGVLVLLIVKVMPVGITLTILAIIFILKTS